MKYARLIIISMVLFSGIAASLPVIAAADMTWDGLAVTCTGESLGTGTGERECNFRDFVELINKVIKFIFYISVPISAIAAAYIGVLLLTSQGDPGKIRRAKQIGWDVVMGFIFIMSAFLIVYTITTAVLSERFTQFLKI